MDIGALRPPPGAIEAGLGEGRNVVTALLSLTRLAAALERNK